MYKLLVCIALLLIVSPVCAQFSSLDPHKNITQYVMRHWAANDGLGSEAVVDIAQSRDGYIWLATYDALVRFDGHRFRLFTAQNEPGIPSSNINNFSQGKDGELWIGTSHGLACYKAGKFLINTDLHPLRKMRVDRTFVTRNNQLWIATASHQLFVYAAGELTEMTSTFQLDKTIIQAIYEDDEGYLWLGTNTSGLIKYKDNQVKTYTLPENTNGVYQIKATNKGIWAATARGLYCIVGDDVKLLPKTASIHISDFEFDQHNNLWMATLNGIMRISARTQKVDRITEKEGLPNEIIQCLLFDKQGNLWAGTYRAGLLQFIDGQYVTYSVSDGLQTNKITGVAELSPEHFFIADESANLHVLHKGQIRPYALDITIPKSRLKHVFKATDGRIFLSTYSGLVVISNGKGKIYNRKSGFPDDFTRFTYQDKSGKIWVGTKTAGLVLFDEDKKWPAINTELGLTANYTMGITETKDSVLVLSTVSGVNLIKNGVVVRQLTVKSGLPSAFAFTAYADNQYVWIATNDGILRYDGKRVAVIDQSAGLPDNSVFYFLEDDDGYFWIPTGTGIFRVAKSELHKVADDKALHLHVEGYGKGHGLKNNHCIGATHSFTDSKGQFWIPTQGGIARVDPKKAVKDTQRIVPKLEEVSVDGLSLPKTKQIQIPAGMDRLNFVFTAFDYKQPDLLRFRYMLWPYDSEWVEAGANRTAVYTNMPPDSYEFRMQAAVNGNWSEDYGVSKVLLLPFWYERAGVKILAVVFILGALLAAYRYRMFLVDKQQAELEGIVRIRTEQLVEQRAKLEDTVKRRTVEVERQKEELEVQAEFLKAVNDELSEKNDELEGYNKKVYQQKNIIERTNEQLKSSIRYALSIQSAMLLGNQSYQKYFDSFILFRPKDIVSGDFYWASPEIYIENGGIAKYIAVVDCTGHGVPGAFMSMIGHQLLNMIVYEKRVIDPKDILQELNHEVQKTLRQHETENTDGMDVCLCRFKLNGAGIDVAFAGAKRPLYHFIPKGSKLLKYAGTRKAIGGLPSRRDEIEFEQCEFSLHKGETLYLSTDGFIHQPNMLRESIGSKRLEQLIIAMGHKNLKEQELEFCKALDQHQGEAAQRDDITIMAVQL